MTAPYSASVIICAYTEARWDYLVAAVESVKRQTTLAGEIILVVDHNPTLLKRARANLSDIVAVESSGQRGLAEARNGGVAVATGDVIAFLDDDAVATSDWLARLLAGYWDESILGVGGAILPLWEGTQPAWFPQEFLWVIGCTYRGMPQRAARVRNLIGTNMSFRRSVFEQVGGFHPGMGRIDCPARWCDETEFCIRIRQQTHGGTLLYEPQALIYHHVPDTRAKWRYFSDRCYAEGLSKAAVSRLVGSRDGLTAEWVHALRTLPAGVLRGLARAAFGRSPSGLADAAAIVAGLAITTTGYLRGTLSESQTLPARRRPVSTQRAIYLSGVDGDVYRE
jgi:glucosyl-dolichyl phosphate glucuronosyltransferase